LAGLVGLGGLPSAQAGGVGPSAGKALGQVLQAERARVGQVPVTAGATIYSQEALATEPQGGLQVRMAGAQLYLLGDSEAALEGGGPGAAARLERGTMVFSAARAGGLELHVAGAQIRALSGPTVGQVSLVGPRELLVSCRRGALEFAFGEEAERIGAGESYRVLLEPAEPGGQEPAGAGTKSVRAPKQANHRRRAFEFLVIGGVAVVTGLAIDEVLESPDIP
jgi:hypothetical protein